MRKVRAMVGRWPLLNWRSYPHHSGAKWRKPHKLLYLDRQIGHADAPRLALRDRCLGREHDEEGPLRQDKGGPGFSAFAHELLAAPVGDTAIAKCLSELHQPKAIPAVQPVTPRLTRRVKAHQALKRMMWATLLSSQLA